MMPGRVPCSPDPNNLLGLSWHDSAWISILNPTNVLNYFSVRSNPFYDRQCNNEIIKMQRLAPDQLVNMTGIEYMLLHVQEPILYVIRKIHRHSPTQVTPLSDYYIIAGVVYQAPDLGSVINSRLLTAVHNLQSTFDDIFSMARYNPSKGYSWDIKNPQHARATNRIKDKKEEISSSFHRQRVDLLIRELTEAFPLDLGNSPSPVEVEENVATEEGAKEEVKEEDIDTEVKEEETELVESSPANPPSEESSKDTVV